MNKPVKKAITYSDLLKALLTGNEAEYKEELSQILIHEILKHKPYDLVLLDKE